MLHSSSNGLSEPQTKSCNQDCNVVRVLQRVLSELEIAVEHCLEADTAVQKLTRQRFEAVIVDCTTMEVASRILKGTQAAPANKRAITVAVVDGQPGDGQTALKSAFSLGAHFVLFKPVSLEKTRSSFRAVRALMKKERRRHARIPIELPVEIHRADGTAHTSSITCDLGENGMAMRTGNAKLPSSFRVRFSLPGAPEIQCAGEVAWESRHTYGIRFRDLPSGADEQLKLWIARQLAGSAAEEPPVNCKLTDLSLNACYLQTESPFPARTQLQLMMKVGELEVQVEGLVRIMLPGAGMGVEFTRHTAGQQAGVEKFIHTLMNSAGRVPDIQVRPDTIDSSAAAFSSESPAGDQADPLLSLFRAQAEFPTETFLMELKNQRGTPQEVGT